MNNKLPKVSIIVPVYGVEQYVKDCLNSIALQDYQGDLECIIVDDRGPDNSMKVVNNFINSYKGHVEFKVITHKLNKGLSGARNTGIKAAAGEYIYLLDSDDEIANDCIRQLATPLLKESFDMVIGDYETIGTTYKFPQLLLNDGPRYGRKTIMHDKRMNLWYQMAVNKLIKKELIEKYNLFFLEGVIHEDELYSYEIACVMQSMYVSKSSKTYLYKVREGSIMTTKNYERRKSSFIKMLHEMNTFILTNSLQQDEDVNTLLQRLFRTANNISLKESFREFCDSYSIYKDSIQRNYGSMTFVNSHFKEMIRDVHLLLPSILGRYVYWFLVLKK